MAIGAPVQSTHGNTFDATNPVLTISSTNAGNLLVLVIGEDSNADRITAATDGTTSLTHWSAADAHNTFGITASVWYLANCNGGKTSITLTGTSITSAWFLYEFPGAATVSPQDAAGKLENQTGANPESGATASLTDAGSVAISLLATQSSGGATAVSTPYAGFMTDNYAGTKDCCTAYVLAPGTGNTHPVFTGAGVSEYCSTTISFKPTITVLPVVTIGIPSTERMGVQVAMLVQDLSPAADGSIGGWTTNLGSTTNLYATLDELVPNDTDYIISAGQSTPDVATFPLASGFGPNAGPRTLNYRYGKDLAGGRRVDLTVELLEGAVVVQTWTHTDIPAGFTEVAQDVSASITNYGALSVRLTSTQL